MLALGALATGLGGAAFALRRKLRNKLAAATQLPSFAAIPPLVPHDPVRDRTKVYVAKGGSPQDNVDDVMTKLGGIEKFVGTDDVVIIKVSAQWWNLGMTNVAAA